MSKQFNLAIVGLGGMAGWHRKTIDEIENISVCGSFDIKEERQQFARDNGIKAYNSLEELLADPIVDIVLCATPNDCHHDIVIKALEAGKNVVCEKPVAMSSQELIEMHDAAVKSGKIFMVHQNRRWDDDFRTVKNIYDKKLLGDIFRIESRVHGSRGIPGDWRQLKEHGGGMILDWGVHLLDQILQMVPGKIKKVYATVTHITNELVDDGFFTDLTFDNGIVVHVEVGTNNFINLPRWYVLGRDGSAIVEWGSKGRMVHITDWSKNDAVPIYTAAGLTKTMAPRTAETIHEDEIEKMNPDVHDFYKNVMDAIEGKAEPLVKFEEVLRVFRLMEAIFESSEKQQVLDFE